MATFTTTPTDFGPASVPDGIETVTVTLTRWPQTNRFLVIDTSVSVDGGSNWIGLGTITVQGGPASTRIPGLPSDIVFSYSLLPQGAARLAKVTVTAVGGTVNTTPSFSTS